MKRIFTLATITYLGACGQASDKTASVKQQAIEVSNYDTLIENFNKADATTWEDMYAYRTLLSDNRSSACYAHNSTQPGEASFGIFVKDQGPILPPVQMISVSIDGILFLKEYINWVTENGSLSLKSPETSVSVLIRQSDNLFFIKADSNSEHVACYFWQRP